MSILSDYQKHVEQPRREQDALEIKALREQRDQLRSVLAFAASVIKSGEPWTDQCERVIGGALKPST